MKFFKKKYKSPKNNDSFFINIVSIFTTLIILLQFINFYTITLLLITASFFITHLVIEIFDKNRALRLIKSTALSLLILYGTFLIIHYVALKVLGIMSPITFIKLDIYYISQIIIGFTIAQYINIKIYSKLKYKFYNKLIILRHIIAVFCGNLSLLIIFLCFNFNLFSFSWFGSEILNRMMFNIADIPLLFIFLWLLKDYGFKNTNTHTNYNKRRFNKDEKYNATNAKSSTNAKRYGNSSK